VGSKSTGITRTDALQLYRLFGDIRALSEPGEQGRVLVYGIAQIVGADAGWFVECAKRDGAWMPVNAGAGSQLDPRLVHYMNEWGRQYPIQFDIMATSITVDARPAYVRRWSEAQSMAAPQAIAPFMDLANTIEVSDMVDPVFCLNPDHRFALNLQRLGRKRRKFTTREIAILELAAEELQWLHATGRLKLSALTRAPAPRPLPPRLKETLGLLLAGRAPKEIARMLGLSLHTVREHITRLYRHFGVSGRDELAARFISGEAKPPMDA
jgi:DNA-binding CsgD family transcriptional regulator